MFRYNLSGRVGQDTNDGPKQISKTVSKQIPKYVSRRLRRCAALYNALFEASFSSKGIRSVSTDGALQFKIVDHLAKGLHSKIKAQRAVMLLGPQLSFDTDSDSLSEPSLGKFCKCMRSAFRNKFRNRF